MEKTADAKVIAADAATADVIAVEDAAVDVVEAAKGVVETTVRLHALTSEDGMALPGRHVAQLKGGTALHG